MSLPAVCPGCGAEYQLPDRLNDRDVYCMDCGEPFLVKGSRPGSEIQSKWPASGRGLASDPDDLPPIPARRGAPAPAGILTWLPIILLVGFGFVALCGMCLFSGLGPTPPGAWSKQTAAGPPATRAVAMWEEKKAPAIGPFQPDQAEQLPEPKVVVEPLKLNEEQLKKLLKAVKLPQGVGETVEALAGLEPDANRAGEVVPVLAAVVRSSDLNPFVRADAARALGRWQTPESLAALGDAVNDSSLFVRHAAIEGLATFGTEKAAFAIVARLRESLDRAHASSILKGMGKVAEPATLAVLHDPSPEVRVEACKILGEVGTVNSMLALSVAVTDINPLVSDAARKARESVRRR